MIAHTLQATPETDAKLKQEENIKGLSAKLNGKPITDCPWTEGSLVAQWWKEGWNAVQTIAVI